MNLRMNHVLIPEEQIENMTVHIVEEDQVDESHIAMNRLTGEFAMVLRAKTAIEDEKRLRQHLEVARYDWLVLLGYANTPLASNVRPEETVFQQSGG